MNEVQSFAASSAAVAFGADHGGFALKEALMTRLRAEGIKVVDCGPSAYDPADDYPVYGAAVARAIVRGEADCGVLVCRTGCGMVITANRFHGIRAAQAVARFFLRYVSFVEISISTSPLRLRKEDAAATISPP